MNTTRPGLRAADHLGLVYKIAGQIHRSVGRHTDIDDLVSHGVEGLMRALERFDPELGFSFTTFAYPRIRGAIWDGIRASCPVHGRQYRRMVASQGPRVFMQSVNEVNPALLRDDAPAADSQCEAQRMRRCLGAALARLSERDRTLLQRHYWDEQTLLAAGATLGFTKSWASRTHAHAIDRLRTEMQAMLGEAA